VNVPKPDQRHYSVVAELLLDGEVVPFLGAGANLTDRPDDAAWEAGRFPPSGAELARALADRSRYPQPHDLDLLRVAQYVDAMLGEGQLYRYLHSVFDADYPPNSLHRFLARMPAHLRERGRPQLLILTTNYDDLLERALIDAGEEFDVVWYEAKRGPQQGRFFHRPPDGTVVPIEIPNKYVELTLAERTVILKLHGAVDRTDSKGDSYVVTENSYIEYLASGDVREQLPFSLKERIEDSHFLFLGYSMRDWNLRVILNRVLQKKVLDLKSWVVQREPADAGVREIEEALWRDRGNIDLLYVPLQEYVAGLDGEFGNGKVTL
jgi:hypothetical protein